MEENRFSECETCRAKPGMPVLCPGCLNNRKVINDLHVMLAGYRGLILYIISNSKCEITDRKSETQDVFNSMLNVVEKWQEKFDRLNQTMDKNIKNPDCPNIQPDKMSDKHPGFDVAKVTEKNSRRLDRLESQVQLVEGALSHVLQDIKRFQ